MRKANKIINRVCLMTVLSLWAFTGISIFFLFTGNGVKDSLIGALPYAFFIWLSGSVILTISFPP